MRKPIVEKGSGERCPSSSLSITTAVPELAHPSIYLSVGSRTWCVCVRTSPYESAENGRAADSHELYEHSDDSDSQTKPVETNHHWQRRFKTHSFPQKKASSRQACFVSVWCWLGVRGVFTRFCHPGWSRLITLRSRLYSLAALTGFPSFREPRSDQPVSEFNEIPGNDENRALEVNPRFPALDNSFFPTLESEIRDSETSWASSASSSSGFSRARRTLQSPFI